MKIRCPFIGGGDMAGAGGALGGGGMCMTVENITWLKGGMIIDPAKRYVLVVEDNIRISMILDEQLKLLGYTAILADNGKIAVDKFNDFIHKG